MENWNSIQNGNALDKTITPLASFESAILNVTIAGYGNIEITLSNPDSSQTEETEEKEDTEELKEDAEALKEDEEPEAAEKEEKEGNNDLEAMRQANISIACGLTHSPANSVLGITDYVIYEEGALCRQLNQLL